VGSNVPLNDLIEKAKTYLPPEKIAVIERAYEFAAKAHEGSFANQGEPYNRTPAARRHGSSLTCRCDSTAWLPPCCMTSRKTAAFQNSEFIEKFARKSPTG